MTMASWMRFLLSITPALWDLYEHITRKGAKDEEQERQIAMRIVRDATYAQAREELDRP